MTYDDDARVYAWSGSYPYDNDPPPDSDPPAPPPSDDEEDEDDKKDAPTDTPSSLRADPRGRGLVCGRFMPPHTGHEHYVRFAKGFARELTLVLFSYPGDPISGELRRTWLEEMFAGVNVIHAANVEPPAREAKDFWERWSTIIRRFVKGPVDWFFTGDIRARAIAKHLGATHVLVDAAREAVPISATAIRERPMASFGYLPACVRPHYVRRVSVLGPESTGKTTLVKALAKHYATAHVPEYARAFAEAERRPFRANELLVIARAQLALESSLARQANRVLFRDTDLRNLRLWSERMFDRCPAAIADAAKEERADLTLITAPDVSFVGAASMNQPAMREAFYRRCIEEVRASGSEKSVVLLTGSWDERIARATKAVDELLAAEALL